MGDTLATMVTMTTYGTWLRGDQRGWVDEGVVYPPDPILEANDLERLKHEPFRFEAVDLHRVGQAIGDSLIERLKQRILALAVRVWHVHFVVAATSTSIGEIVKCAKDATRYALHAGRPIWTDGYDKRFCFDEVSLRNRIAYVERHNIEHGWPPRPWDFIVPPNI